MSDPTKLPRQALLTFEMTREEALKRGLLTCANCGHQPNNHFDHGEGPCAHCLCKGYDEVARMGMHLVKKLTTPKRAQR